MALLNELQREVLEWNQDPQVKAVLFSGVGKAFCAGGDVRALYEAKQGDQDPSIL